MEKNAYPYSINDSERIEFRLISSDDSIEELTQLLNKSYKVLADMGLNYVAATQDDSITLDRVRYAYKCYVGISKNKIVSTISLYSPGGSDKSSSFPNPIISKFLYSICFYDA